MCSLAILFRAKKFVFRYKFIANRIIFLRNVFDLHFITLSFTYIYMYANMIPNFVHRVHFENCSVGEVLNENNENLVINIRKLMFFFFNCGFKQFVYSRFCQCIQ
jgi:hypothetical protein